MGVVSSSVGVGDGVGDGTGDGAGDGVTLVVVGAGVIVRLPEI